MIYLDNAASTPILPQVKSKLLSCLDIYGNPSSLHNEGAKAKQLINETKIIIAHKLHCSTDELYFTSGASMSNSLVLQGFQGNLLYSAIEHEDIQLLGKDNLGYIIPVNADGTVNLEKLNNLIKTFCANTSTIISIQAANSEIGTIQDLQTISQIIHSYTNAYLHVDATQYIPYFELNAQKLNIDALSMSGQKIGCIKGMGLLYISDKLKPKIKPIIYGAQGLIGGTENVPGIVCLGEAFKYLDYSNNKRISQLRDKLVDGLNGTLVGPITNRLPNNACICFDGLDSTAVVMLLNEYGICASSGSACSSTSSEPSHVLKAIGLSDENANSCVRFTLSKNTTEEEIDKTIDITNRITGMLREL